MRAVVKILMLCFLLCSVPVLTQQSLQQVQATGAIEGVVLNDKTGEPVIGAQVEMRGNITSIPPRPQEFDPVNTGADGKFRFKDLHAGTYRLRVTANGFVEQAYGQRAVNGPGRALFLASGQVVRDAAFRLMPTGSVSGRIFDENGMPAVGAPVQLFRPVYTPEGRTMQSGGTANADDRGEYRIYGITPGRFFLQAGDPAGPPRGRPSATATRYRLAYYPDVDDMDRASMIEVKAGTEVSFDVRVRKQLRSYSVRGHVIDSMGAPLPANLRVNLGYQNLTQSGGMGTTQFLDSATGAFELMRIPPGNYTITVEPPRDQQAARTLQPFGFAEIHIGDANIEGVVLNINTGAHVSGRFMAEGLPLSELANIQQLTLEFSTPTGGLSSLPRPIVLPTAADGTFEVQGLRETEYRVSFVRRNGGAGPIPAASGFYVKSIRYGGQDILGKPFKFSGSGPGEFEVTFRRGTSQISGTVTDSKSQPVPGMQIALIPQQRHRTDLYRPSMTDQNGVFTFSSIPPGEYKLFSWEAMVNDVFNPEFLKEYETQGKTVHLLESTTQNVDVKLIPDR
jgi:hypothetical protein